MRGRSMGISLRYWGMRRNPSNIVEAKVRVKRTLAGPCLRRLAWRQDCGPGQSSGGGGPHGSIHLMCIPQRAGSMLTGTAP